jgi:hypothetical protein
MVSVKFVSPTRVPVQKPRARVWLNVGIPVLLTRALLPGSRAAHKNRTEVLCALAEALGIALFAPKSQPSSTMSTARVFCTDRPARLVSGKAQGCDWLAMTNLCAPVCPIDQSARGVPPDSGNHQDWSSRCVRGSHERGEARRGAVRAQKTGREALI